MTMHDQLAAAPLGHSDHLPDDLAAAALTMARRFAAGATMWCVSPPWPHHARHVAVEFVHPVIVGKRALAALLVPPTEDPVSSIRASGVSGDLLLAIAPADDPTTVDLLRRAAAWGLTTVWIGTGPRPTSGAADHVLWLDDDTGLAPHDGRFILLYHLLWELTHVCFEHPGALKDPDACDDGEVCITCSDEGILGEVVRTGEHEALVRTPDGTTTVDTTLVGPLSHHDLVLVHAGVAIAALDDAPGSSAINGVGP